VGSLEFGGGPNGPPNIPINQPPGGGPPIPTIIPNPPGGGSEPSGGSHAPYATSRFIYNLGAANQVAFSNISLGYTRSHWYFGDGTESTLNNPVHAYVLPGTYDVILRVYNATGQSSDASQNVVVVTVDPVALFSFSVGVLSVWFTDLSTTLDPHWNWSFGDGASSTDHNPVHKYPSNGTYTVTLVTGGFSVSHTVTINVSLQLSWTSHSGGSETGFHIYQSLDGSSWTLIGTVGSGVTSFGVNSSQGVNTSALNYYKVAAYDINGESGFSNVIAAQCGGA
jgi:PKD repeat protein